MPSPAEIVDTGWVYWISHRDQLLRLERSLRPDILSKTRALSQVTDRRVGTSAHAETEHRSLMRFVSIVTAADIEKSHFEVVYTARRKARPVYPLLMLSPRNNALIRAATFSQPASRRPIGIAGRFPNPSQWTQERLLSRFRGHSETGAVRRI